MNVLVTGGAGYVGSIVAEELLKAGHNVVVLDSLKEGHRQAVPHGAAFVQGDLADVSLLKDTFGRYQTDSIMHMAAETVVEQSMTNPKAYFSNNLCKGITLLDVALEHGIRRFVFSSTAAVYGEPVSIPIKENDPHIPTNSYGESKLLFEKVLKWYRHAYGLQYICLRYFNAAGASDLLGEYHQPETHLIPIILQVALKQREQVYVFGTDYNTKDGSCIRDYIHVQDLAQAHILALKELERFGGNAYNLGNSNGYSVIEVLDEARRMTGREIPTVFAGRRAGDPAMLVASSEAIRTDLGWEPKHPELGEIIESAWNWHRRHPHGYTD